MIEAAAANGWIDRRTVITESLIAIRRAGATNVLTYYAAEVAGWLREELAGPSVPAAPVSPSGDSAPSAETPVHPRVEPHTTAAPVEASTPSETSSPTNTDGDSTDEPRTDAGFPPVS